MLNYNKIKSNINSGDSKNSELIRFLKINQSTFYDKLKRESFTPNELEKIAEYFKRPISYYFDKKENEVNESPEKYTVTRVNCLECILKQKEIDALTRALDAKDELLDMYRKKETNCG